MRSALYGFIARAGLPKAFRVLRPQGTTILTYHGFTDRLSSQGVVDHQHMRLHVAAFRCHLEHLAAHYRVISLSSLMKAYERGEAGPKGAVVLTFDDGYRSCYALAHPLLVEFAMPATFFLATDFVFGRRALWHDRVEHAVHSTDRPSIALDLAGTATVLATSTRAEKLASLRIIYRAIKKGDQGTRDTLVDHLEREAGVRLDLASAPEEYAPVSVDQLRAMADQGLVEMGCHTKSHAILARCNDEELETEIVDAKRAIETALGRSCNLFCYPNGAVGDFDPRTRAALVRAGFSCALTTVPGKNDASSDRMELRRIGAPHDFSEFEVAVSGLRTELRRAYRAARLFDA